ncbi:MAG: DEAD/DEAH box helicase family protein [Chloroflexi bacterium]|nr:DEAD/DEAH box helicase family protein [Chloroflexota bacterium]
MSEAQARIKINKLLEKAGWRFFNSPEGPANVILEGKASLPKLELDGLGDDFEKTRTGFMDFLLLDEQSFPFVILEAKKEERNPLDGKEQARKYARSQNVRFVILSNGNLHYFWDLESGNPEIITEFPRQESILHRRKFSPNPELLAREQVSEDYIALSQNPEFKKDPRWLDSTKRPQLITDTGLRILRGYQLRAVHALQKSAAEGSTRFLFEMATGTGKTLVSAAVIKLFLRTGNVSRVLFLVDRIELENQAYKSFNQLLKNDYQTVIYKEKRQEWRKAEIVVSTIQSFMTDNKYLRLFSPTDFDLIISDEAHRSIGGNSRAVFEYFVGYKLGLTATPRNYLKNIDPEKLSQADPRAWEQRQLLDTYQTFGCAQGEPTFRYSLVDGVREGYLVNPIVVDARTEISTKLLSENGYAITVVDENGNENEDTFFQRDFERRFFSEETNRQFCRAFVDNALTDPITGELGKSILFCVSQNHASKITQLLNEMAHARWPGRYNSDFAVQVTSNIPGAQEFAISFSNNNLNGHSRVVDGYKTSRTRVCVTVGMMTTGYDCTDILNLAMMRPIFSPTDFIQMKGRGTRRHNFRWKNNRDHQGSDLVVSKENFKLFDFFANYEYFENEFNYDEVLELPKKGGVTFPPPEPPPPIDHGDYENRNPDPIHAIGEIKIGWDGMKIDRKLFENFSKPILEDQELSNAVAMRQWERAVQILRDNYANKPEDYVTIDKLMRAEGLDRRLTWKEVLMRIFGMIERFKTRDELLEEEFLKFVAVNKPTPEKALPLRNLMTVYLTDLEIRKIIDTGAYSLLADNPKFSLTDLHKIGKDGIEGLTSYIKDYITLNTFAV